MMKNIFVGFVFLILLSPITAMADYQDGRDAFDRGDYSTAVKEFKMLAQKNDPRGQYALAVLYDLGEGVSQSSKEAVKLYRLAAEQGFADAQNNLGVAYDQGEGVGTDYKVAMKWYLLAAERGNRDAPNNIGVLHMIGFGVPRSFLKAHTWFTIAGAGDSEAIRNKNFLEKKLTSEQLAESKRRAEEWQQIWLKR
jgi:uncharacterized protein